MRLVNSNAFIVRFDAVWMSPHKLLLWVPEHAVEMTLSLLHLHRGPSRVSVHPAVIGALDLNLVLGSVRDSGRTIWIGLDKAFETTIVIFLADELSTFPVVEFSEKAHVFCSWTPLHKRNITIFLQVETKLLVGSRHIFNTTFSSLENIEPSKI